MLLVGSRNSDAGVFTHVAWLWIVGRFGGVLGPSRSEFGAFGPASSLPQVLMHLLSTSQPKPLAKTALNPQSHLPRLNNRLSYPTRTLNSKPNTKTS